MLTWFDLLIFPFAWMSGGCGWGWGGSVCHTHTHTESDQSITNPQIWTTGWGTFTSDAAALLSQKIKSTVDNKLWISHACFWTRGRKLKYMKKEPQQQQKKEAVFKLVNVLVRGNGTKPRLNLGRFFTSLHQGLNPRWYLTWNTDYLSALHVVPTPR